MGQSPDPLSISMDVLATQRRLDRETTPSLMEKADNILPDKLTIRGKSYSSDQVVRDPALSREAQSSFEKLTLQGRGDFTDHIAILREIRDRFDSNGPSRTARDLDTAIATDAFNSAALNIRTNPGEMVTKMDRGTLEAVSQQTAKSLDSFTVRTPTALLGGRG